MTLNEFTVPHSGAMAIGEDGHARFTEGAHPDWQLLRLSGEAFNRQRVHFRVCFRFPEAQEPRSLYVNLWGGLCLVAVDAQGRVHAPDPKVRALFLPEFEVSTTPTGALAMTVAYNSFHPSVSLGLMQGGQGVYAGSGASVVIEDFEWLGGGPVTAAHLDHPVNVIDIGAAFGLHHAWEPYAGQGSRIQVLMFEPSAVEAARLRSMYPGLQVLEVGLSNHSGQVVLHETAHPGCSSVYRPNTPFLARYRIADWFREVRDHTIAVERYDRLLLSGQAPRPDFVKIDVQGYEYEILQGFGDTLNDILVLEVEAHFYPIYHGQKLLHDLVDMMALHGMMLCAVRPQMNFDQDLVEVNAYFARKPDLVDEVRRPVLDQIMRVMNL